ncbi:MAG: hypothetical protein Q9166_001281 [cf. Caloplaca sp. 2 TL-2023]
MSGNFDFAPAPSPQSVPPARNRPQPRRVEYPLETLRTRPASRANLETQRRLLEVQLQETEAEIARRHHLLSPGSVPSSQAPTSSPRSRHRQMPPNTSFPWLQARGRANRALRGGSQIMQEAVDRLNQASSHISMALDHSLPRTRSPDINSQEYSSEAAVNEANRQRAKRRKLNDPMPSRGFGPNYGYCGQVVPGRLRMELVFCDGGLHETGERKYCPENVLRNDLSVYCTRSNKCDLVLRHQGGAPFCLQKLVVKAPENGFTAPLQEGMIFISMDNQGLIRKASRYVLRDADSPSPPSSPLSTPQSPVLLTNSYPAFDPTPQRDVDQNRPPSRRRTDDGTDRVIPPPISNFAGDPSLRRVHNRTWQTSSPRHNTSLMSRHRLPETDLLTTVNEPLNSHFNVSIDCENHSDDEEESSSEATLADRLYRDRIPSSHDDSDDADNPDLAQYLYRSGGNRRSVPSSGRRHGRRSTPRRIVISPPSVTEDRGQGNESADVLMPHAIIFIEKEKSMVSIKFDPPV